jgi:uncharacterized membrane protein
MVYKDPVNHLYFGIIIIILSLLEFLISVKIDNKENRTHALIFGICMFAFGIIYSLVSYIFIKKEKILNTEYKIINL